MSEYGYWVNLPSYKFEEDDGTWVQAMVAGTYQHPQYGEIEITPQRIQQFAANVAANVRGQELDIDYDHKDKTGEAAGWVKGARAIGDKLELLVKWTDTAKAKIKEGAYRYFSPEYTDEWEAPTGGKYKDVLFGGALTNRPFLKNMAPINMTEVMKFEEEPKAVPPPPVPPTPPKPPKEGNMTVALKEVLVLLGLPEDADKDTITTKCSELTKLKAEKEGTDPLSEPGLLALAEANPALRSILDRHEQDQKRLDELEKSRRMTESESKVRRLCSPAASKIVVTPVLQDHLVRLFTELPDQLHAALSDVVDYFVKGKGVVELGERGFARRTSSSASVEDDPAAAFMALANRLKDERQLKTMSEALSAASTENPLLYQQYRTGSYAFSEHN